MLGSPDDTKLEELEYILGVDVCQGMIGSTEVVKTIDATGFHMDTLLAYCIT
jgi:hypothetical protein